MSRRVFVFISHIHNTCEDLFNLAYISRCNNMMLWTNHNSHELMTRREQRKADSVHTPCRRNYINRSREYVRVSVVNMCITFLSLSALALSLFVFAHVCVFSGMHNPFLTIFIPRALAFWKLVTIRLVWCVHACQPAWSVYIICVLINT